MSNDPAQIKPYLYLGSCLTAQNREKLSNIQCKYIINVAIEIPNTFESDPSLRYIHLRLDDNPNQLLNEHFDTVFNVIQQAKDEGISRSSSFVLAWLIKAYQMSLKESFDYVREVRPNVAPNIGFWEQLLDFEEDLIGSRSSSLIEIMASQLVDMGFDREMSEYAVELCGGNFELAVSVCLRQLADKKE
eukprot:TRINITY_DN1418_c0_g1_i1.p1 TRINITY_DN1418_c0_g1~~TRINITY_DN1418_c0_g1_i1.p1  ORF type:complete len:206 (+),score=31.56 TRINITY_DN1418_c0_g1_i1:53-619(+)